MFPDIKQRWYASTRSLLVLVCLVALSGCGSHDRQPQSVPAVDGSSAASKDVTIALLGATGLVGGYILEQALAQGYDVRVLARSPQKLARFGDRITIVQGDALDPSTIASLLQGSDVVISALGPVKADGDAAKMLNATVTGLIVEAMSRSHIQRYILVSGAAVVMPGDDRNFTGWLMRQMVLLSLNDALQDKQAEYELLAESSIDWTLIRCPLIDAAPYIRRPAASLTSPTSFSLRAGELAWFVIDQIDSQEFIRKGPFLDSR